MRSRKIFFHLLSIVLFSSLAAAQFTLVSGTVTDPNGTPYALGTISAQVVTAGVTPTVNGSAFSMSAGPANLSTAGSFTLNLVSSTAMAPNLQWKFTVCSSAGTILPAGGTGPVCFTSTITITGATQSISATLSAAAPALSAGSGPAGAFKAAVTIPAAGTTFTPATGTTAKFIGGSGDAFDFVDALGGGLYLDDPAEFPNAIFLQDDSTRSSLGLDSTGSFLLSEPGTVAGGLVVGSGSSCGGVGLVAISASPNQSEFFLDPTGSCPDGIPDVLGLAGADDAGDLFTFAAGLFKTSTTFQAAKYLTTAICAAAGTAANPSVAACVTASAGAFSCSPSASAGTCQVTSSAVTVNSAIFIQPTAASAGLTCNAVADTGLTAPRLLSQAVGNFVITLGTFTTTAECFKFWVVD